MHVACTPNRSIRSTSEKETETHNPSSQAYGQAKSNSVMSAVGSPCETCCPVHIPQLWYAQESGRQPAAGSERERETERIALQDATTVAMARSGCHVRLASLNSKSHKISKTPLYHTDVIATLAAHTKPPRPPHTRQAAILTPCSCHPMHIDIQSLLPRPTHLATFTRRQ